MSRFVDKRMEKIGYNKTDENYFGARYEKEEKQGFIHVVYVLHKASKKHIMQSYDAEVLKINGEYLNEGCGVEIPVLFLMWLKAKWLSVKYGWWKEKAT